jgi:hypothetical protein
MDEQIKRAIVAIVRPPLVGVMFVMRKTYSTFFGWYDRILARRAKNELALEVQENLSFLFTEYCGQFVPNDREPPSMLDLAKVTVAADDMRFMFSRDRGSIHAAVAPAHSPNEWQDLSALLQIIESREVEFSRLPSVARLLRPRMSQIKSAISQGEFHRTKELLSSVYDDGIQITRRRERALNRRLYGP